MSMKVERSSLEQVKARFELNKRKQEEKKSEYDFNERMKELQEEVVNGLATLVKIIILGIQRTLEICIFIMISITIFTLSELSSTFNSGGGGEPTPSPHTHVYTEFISL